MRPMLLAVPAIAAAAVFLGACDAPSTATSAPATTTSTSSAPAGAGAGSTTTTGTTTSNSKTGDTKTTSTRTTTAAPVCRTRDLTAVVTWQPQGDTTQTHRGLVTLSNKKKNSCTVEGWAAISLVNAADEVVPVKSSQVNQPGKPVKITLRPGGSAWAGIKWTACDKGDSSCGAGNTLRFNLEASTDGDVAHLEGFPNPEDSDITMKRLQIGSLQPSNQGVVAW
ncbi:DUF4232 domain-containing protein [Couchioplanes caeruleus]|uniref:DUF4232 domain-containing protein n=1 Tax=Couchioplanes caeruleus TaxID=56438 RepID=UPI0020BFB701|nr:DUF4232 domain-containing protein [Couchioplanes caeruleus]UQU66546.1 DUF4232 domain-containing protein [Couchioplanes caeruleus]